MSYPKHGLPCDTSRSYADMERIAASFRDRLGLPVPLPGRELFERLGRYSVSNDGRSIPFDYAVNELPGGVEAKAVYESDDDVIVLMLSPETYGGLEEGVPRARFSLAHEIGHALLHTRELVRLSRIPCAVAALLRGPIREHPVHRDSEWQAHAFAGALLMPAKRLLDLERAGRLTPEDLQVEFCVSKQASEIRIDVYRKKRTQLLT